MLNKIQHSVVKILAEPQPLLSRRVPLRIRERGETFGLERSLRRWSNTIFAVYLHISSYAPHRPKVSMLSPLKAEGLSAISASHTYLLRGSIRSAALREKSDNQGQHWVSTKN